MDDELIALIAKRFIQRRDVYAQQISDGTWRPVTEPIRKPQVAAHLNSEVSNGHYLLDADSQCKFFAFDIDLNKAGFWPLGYDRLEDPANGDPWCEAPVAHEFNPREAWRNRAHPSRAFQKNQMRMLAEMLANTTRKMLELPVAVTYSGYKGLHVYGFTGSLPAVQVREGAQIVLDALGCFEPSRGKAFWAHKNTDPIDGYVNLSVEVFPKQTELSDGGYGNLMSLPLGKSSHGDPRFFVDLRAPMAQLVPDDPKRVLLSGNPWSNS